THDGRQYFSGGAGLCPTIGDYARFAQMVANGGELEGARILKPETVAQMTRNQLGDLKIDLVNNGDGFGYGFGVWTERAGPRPPDASFVGSFGWGGFFNTSFWVDPQKQLIGVMMTQVYPSKQLKLREEIQHRTYQALMP